MIILIDLGDSQRDKLLMITIIWIHHHSEKEHSCRFSVIFKSFLHQNLHFRRLKPSTIWSTHQSHFQCFFFISANTKGTPWRYCKSLCLDSLKNSCFYKHHHMVHEEMKITFERVGILKRLNSCQGESNITQQHKCLSDM